MDFILTHAIPPKTEEAKWEYIEDQCRMRLLASDWTQLADVIKQMDPDEQAAWLNYRQTLRNIPQVFASAEEIEFPDEPVRKVQARARDINKLNDK